MRDGHNAGQSIAQGADRVGLAKIGGHELGPIGHQRWRSPPQHEHTRAQLEQCAHERRADEARAARDQHGTI